MSDSERYVSDGEDFSFVDSEWDEEEEEDDEELATKALERALNKTLDKEWIPYRGPEGGEGWQNTEDPDDVRYGLDEPPGEVADHVPDEVLSGWAGYDTDHSSDDESPGPEGMSLGEVVSRLKDTQSTITNPNPRKSASKVITDLLSEGEIDTDMAMEAIDFVGATVGPRSVLRRASGTVNGIEEEMPLNTSHTEFSKEFMNEKLSNEEFETQYDATQGWVRDMFVPDSRPIWKVAKEITGNNTVGGGAPNVTEYVRSHNVEPVHRHDRDIVVGDEVWINNGTQRGTVTRIHDDMFEVETDENFIEKPTDHEKVEDIREVHEKTVEAFREAFGDTVMVYRGYSAEGGHNPTAAEPTGVSTEIASAKEDGASIEHSHRACEAWTTNPDYSKKYASEGKSGAMLRKEVPVERIVLASHTSSLQDVESEVIVAHEEEEEYSPDQIITQSELLSQGSRDKILRQVLMSVENTTKSSEKAGEVRQVGLKPNAQWLHDMDIDDDFEKNWIPYRGPQGGEGWQNTQDPDDVRYGLDEPPGEVAAGYDEDHWERDQRSVSEADHELGYVSGENGPTLNVTTASEAESLSEAGASEGASSRHMHVATWRDGDDVVTHRAFVTNYGPDMERNRTGEKPLLGERAASADAFLRNLGFGENLPKHFLNRQQRYLAVEAKPGKEVRDAPNEWTDKIDKEQAKDFAAGVMLAGNSDLHPKNVIVNEDGSFYAVDLDKSGGDFVNGPDRFQRRGIQSIRWSLRQMGVQMSQKDLNEHVTEVAQRYDPDDILEDVPNSMWSDKNRHQFRDNIRSNIEAAKEGNLLQ